MQEEVQGRTGSTMPVWLATVTSSREPSKLISRPPKTNWSRGQAKRRGAVLRCSAGGFTQVKNGTSP
jgi:hypothetical protein